MIAGILIYLCLLICGFVELICLLRRLVGVGAFGGLLWMLLFVLLIMFGCLIVLGCCFEFGWFAWLVGFVWLFCVD